jgi:hypothetical protein
VFTGIVVRPPLDEITLPNVFLIRERNILGSDDNVTVFMEVPPNLPATVTATFAFPFNTTFPPIYSSQKCLNKYSQFIIDKIFYS